jgi:polygalacturonase
VRESPPVVQNVNISNVTVSDVTLGSATGSCFQAIVAQGPVGFDYNEPAPTPAIPPISGVTISNCNLGTPVNNGTATATTPGPIYTYNVNGITLKNVIIGSTTYNTTLVDSR